MINHLIDWAVNNRLVVILLALALTAFGGYAFIRINVEAYPDPAPAIVEIIALYQGASSEEVERQVTIPLEVALAGMPGLDTMRSQSMFQLCDVRCQFHYGTEYKDARQEVLNRLTSVDLPAGVEPFISPESPTGEIVRFTMESPKDADGREIYTLNDLKSLLDFTIERRLRRVPRIADVASYGGTMKQYEIRPDPARMQRYNVTLQQLENAVSKANANVGGQYVNQGETVQVVRGLGLIGQGQDPIEKAMAMDDPLAASAYLREQEAKRIRQIRQIVLASTDNVPIRVGDVVEGGPLGPGDSAGARGVVVAFRNRLGRVLISKPKVDLDGAELRDPQGRRAWSDEDDVVQGIVLLRKGEESLPALRDVMGVLAELNDVPGRLLPGVKIVPYYDRTHLVNTTTETVRENLFHGMALVGIVLLMFLGNVRTALIVAVNVPLAVLVAFAALYLRGESANLLSIGAVDFGILVDSSVIMVENIYRHLTGGIDAELPLADRVRRAATEVQRSLLFSTAIMVCAFLPLFVMEGPAGQIFRPMAHTYAFALAGALLLAVTLSPVLCVLLLGRVAPKPDNFFVRWLTRSYAAQLRWALRFRFVSLGLFAAVLVVTATALPFLGREFMPQLEEGNIYVRGTFPLNASLDEVTTHARIAREVFKHAPEVETVVAQVGRPDDGTDPTGFYNVEFYVPMKPREDWPVDAELGRPRTKDEIVDALSAELNRELVGVSWDFSQYIRDNVLEAMSGVKGENSVKIVGPDLKELEKKADQVMNLLNHVPGVTDVGVFRIMGQSNLSFPIDLDKTARWNVSVDDVQDALRTAVGGKAVSQVVEGERAFDLVLRWPEPLRSTCAAILDIPVDVGAHVVEQSVRPSLSATSFTGAATGPAPMGSEVPMPSLTGSTRDAALNYPGRTPRRKLGDLVTPLNEDVEFDPATGSVHSLPRTRSTADRHQVRCRRPRLGRRRGRGASEGRAGGRTAIPRRMVRRIRADAAGRRAIDGGGAAFIRPGDGHALSRVSLAPRRDDRVGKRRDLGLRGRARPALGWDELQRLRGRRLHFRFWGGHHERPDPGLFDPPSAASGQIARRSGHAGREEPPAADADDDPDRYPGPFARRPLHADRGPEPAASGSGCHRRDAHVVVVEPASHACPLPRFPRATSLERVRWIRRIVSDLCANAPGCRFCGNLPEMCHRYSHHNRYNR